jgi:peroxiredoxin
MIMIRPFLFTLALIALTACSSPQAPDLTLTDIDGVQHAVLSKPQSPLLVIFWATDCPGCIKEIPELIALHDQFAAQGLRFLAIALAHDTPAQLQAMRARKQLPYPIIWDETGEIAAAFNQVRVTPTHFLISPTGDILMRKIGELNMDALKEKLHSMGLQES